MCQAWHTNFECIYIYIKSKINSWYHIITDKEMIDKNHKKKVNKIKFSEFLPDEIFQDDEKRVQTCQIIVPVLSY